MSLDKLEGRRVERQLGLEVLIGKISYFPSCLALTKSPGGFHLNSQVSKIMGNPPQVYRHYDLLFTPYLIPRLRNLKGKEWAELIDRLSVLPETHPDALAFAMMMIKLGGCLPCQMDSYRAQRGCALCARNTILGFKGSDEQLITRYENARKLMAEQIAEFELEQAA